MGSGSVTDYIIRLAPCSVFIIKNWRTVPKENESAIYVVFYAVGSVAALLQLQLCCREPPSLPVPARLGETAVPAARLLQRGTARGTLSCAQRTVDSWQSQHIYLIYYCYST